MFKKIIGTGVLLIMIFSLSACNVDMFNSQGQLADLQKKIEKLEERIADLEDENNLLAKNNKLQDDRVADLEQEINDLKDKVSGLELFHVNSIFLSVQDAYGYGLLTREDIAQIIYFRGRSVLEIVENPDEFYEYEGELYAYEYLELQDIGEVAVKRYEFDTDLEKPVLDTKLEKAIRWAYYYNDSHHYYTPYELSVDFLGEYNGCYAVIINGPWAWADEDLGCINLAGFVWSLNHPQVTIFIY